MSSLVIALICIGVVALFVVIAISLRPKRNNAGADSTVHSDTPDYHTYDRPHNVHDYDDHGHRVSSSSRSGLRVRNRRSSGIVVIYNDDYRSQRSHGYTHWHPGGRIANVNYPAGYYPYSLSPADFLLIAVILDDEAFDPPEDWSGDSESGDHLDYANTGAAAPLFADDTPAEEDHGDSGDSSQDAAYTAPETGSGDQGYTSGSSDYSGPSGQSGYTDGGSTTSYSFGGDSGSYSGGSDYSGGGGDSGGGGGY